MSWMSRHFWNIKNWHWVSSAICLIGLLLFAATGITLNHAADIESEPQIASIENLVPASLLRQLKPSRQLPQTFYSWYKETTGMALSDSALIQWEQNELYVASPRPGGDRWFTVALDTGEFYQEATDRGTLAYLNDLHKGRNTGPAWRWFIDIFSAACVVFSLTGLWLLKRYAKGRKSTWPLVIAGLLIPVAFLLYPAHAEADELKITLPRIKVAEYHAPYVAVWLADDKAKRVKDIAVWYDTQMENQKGEKWLKDLRLWWRRSGRSAELPIDGVSGATRRPGTSTVDLDGTFDNLPAGNYVLYVEAARELGGREVLSVPLTLPVTTASTEKAQGKNEITTIELKTEPHS
ncbi:DUF2271 domain-containing protein [Alteromonas pelagimontana]|uniref:DUF2271 domain-containing protein n=1 Tax=Alteromonas pelagimontana TaxID=1858656 RepID=A0A6M4MDN4_9ALTE|nr:PepSY-associated TM helix domain-containing protein [Alteromonas pelagimontana]QJR80695.1 DUF2271 domain-containing protein [Alteromonas pelagimontana]